MVEANANDDGTTIKLQCSEDQIIEVNKSHAEASSLIKGLIDDGGDDDAPLPIPQVSASVMTKCIQYVEL